MKTIWTAGWQKRGGFVGTVLAMLVGISLTAVAQETVTLRPPQELDALLAPVALYPDALMAVMLPAATAPADIVLAARYLAAGGAVEQLDAQPWDDSVRTLAHYPELTQWMAANFVWTQAVGDAFRAQPADVMAAVQRLRARAQALGNLTSTPQQCVSSDQNVITIVPADPEVVYVPQYDPQVIYLQPAPFGGSWLNFGYCWRIGAWHRYDFDWRRCDVRIREQHPQYRHPVEVIRAWHPAPVASHQSVNINRSPAAQQSHVFSAAAPQHSQASQVVLPKAQAVASFAAHEVQLHNAVVPHVVERASEPVNVRHESIYNHEREVETHGTINRESTAQPAVQRSLPQARPESRVWPQSGNAPAAPVMQPALRHDAAARQPTPVNVQHSVPVVHQPAPLVVQQAVPTMPHARPDVRQSPGTDARANAATAPQQAPRVLRSAPAAQPAPQAADVHGGHAAPPATQNQHTAPQSGNNQGNADRGAGGRWGNVARGN